MSNATRGPVQSCLPHTHRPITGLFFLLTFFLLIIIPASAYFEIGAKTFLQRERPETALLYRCGMTATQYVPVKNAPGSKTVPPILERKSRKVIASAPQP